MSDRNDLSDEDQDIDIESDEDDTNSALGGNQFASEADKKAHHNLLERKRRDHIKSSFVNLRDSIPLIRKEKSSRAQILKSATEYIQFMTKKNSNIQKDIDNMKRQNHYLRQQLVTADKLRPNGAQSVLASSEFATYGDEIGVNGGGNSSEESTGANERNVTTTSSRRRKRQRVR